MFDVGGGELVLIFIAVLLLFGPKKIPEVMRSVGKGLRQFRDAQEDLKNQLRDISTEVEKSADINPARRTFDATQSASTERATSLTERNTSPTETTYEHSKAAYKATSATSPSSDGAQPVARRFQSDENEASAEEFS